MSFIFGADMSTYRTPKSFLMSNFLANRSCFGFSNASNAVFFYSHIQFCLLKISYLYLHIKILKN
ncbi:MAG: hypothetical protein EAZ67_04545 [Cytophagales bacterium]|nr:MAG: hypothetical protein EAZ67_04545 [Cytophagales bacterium]